MKNDKWNSLTADHRLGCFGDFNRDDLICRRHCALRLKCAVESEKNIRMEMLEEIMSFEGLAMKMQ